MTKDYNNHDPITRQRLACEVAKTIEAYLNAYPEVKKSRNLNIFLTDSASRKSNIPCFLSVSPSGRCSSQDFIKFPERRGSQKYGIKFTFPSAPRKTFCRTLPLCPQLIKCPSVFRVYYFIFRTLEVSLSRNLVHPSWPYFYARPRHRIFQLGKLIGELP